MPAGCLSTLGGRNHDGGMLTRIRERFVSEGTVSALWDGMGGFNPSSVVRRLAMLKDFLLKGRSMREWKLNGEKKNNDYGVHPRKERASPCQKLSKCYKSQLYVSL